MKTYATFAIMALAGISAAILPGCVVTGTVYEHRPRPVHVDRSGPVVIERPGPVVIERPGPVVIQRPAPAQVIVVRQPPPPPRVEVIQPRPGPELIWVPGYYAPQGGGWIWVAGRYERPPRPNAVWVPPRHEVRGADRIEVTLGFWR